MNRSLTALVFMMASLALSAPGIAQERPQRGDSVAVLNLPPLVAQSVVDFFNDPGRIRYEGDVQIVRGDTVSADIAVREGTLDLGGRIEGSIVIVNGDLALRPGAEITGDVLVVGGSVTGTEQAIVRGEILSYPERLRYIDEGRRIRRVEGTPGEAPRTRGGRMGGRSDFLITSGKSYNRVEGLPITFGPRIETPGPNPLRVHALAIYRTESGITLNTDRMGYFVRADQFLGGRQRLRVGATAHSTIVPIEEWQLSDLENGLATFLFHRDFRDYYERQGVSLFTRWEPRPAALNVGAEVRFERHRSQQPGSPWTLFDNAAPWREQPLVAEGRVGIVALESTYGTRSGAADPADGWYLSGRVEQSFGSDLQRPGVYEAPPPHVSSAGVLRPASPVAGFRTGLIDIRRYNRVDPDSRLNFRLLAGGSLDGRSLPPQRQHALGGEGSLPGYELFSLDCGARDRLVHRPDTGGGSNAFYPAYGCDRFALFQTEYRGKLGLRFRLDPSPWDDAADDDRGWGLDLDLAPDWVLFVNSARGWSADVGGRDEDLAVDAGVGLLINRIGLYVAHPLTRGSGLNFFIRLGHRF